MRFRKVPVEVEALPLDGNTVRVAEWLAANDCQFWAVTHPTDSRQDVLYIVTLEGEMRADPGDWIIKGVEGEFYPCKPRIFAQTYEQVQVAPDGSTAYIEE